MAPRALEAAPEDEMATTRQSRTFKMRLSQSGMDLLIDSHCHLIRSTRALLAWGTTLHVAVACLESASTDAVRDQLVRLADAGLSGCEEHHLGAPKRLCDIAAGIARRVGSVTADEPNLSHIYIVALQYILRLDPDTLRRCYERTRSGA
jgi:hypothetical protein